MASSMTSTAGGGGGVRSLQDAFPDLHHKMSKKIAQLTKVIYHLNTKQEDRVFELQEVKSHHQKEMQDILKDAASKIARFKEQLESRKSEVNLQAQLEKLKEKHTKEKRTALADFRTFKEEAAGREEQLVSETKQRMEALTSDVTEQRAKFEKGLKVLKRRAEELKQAGLLAESSMEAEREKHKAEVADIVRESNEKMNRMMLERRMMEEELKNNVSNSIAASAAAAKKAEEQALGRLRAEMSAEREAALLAAKRKANDELHKEKSEFMARLDKAVEEASAAAKLGERYKAERDETEKTLRELTKGREGDMLAVEEKESTWRTMLAERAAEIDRLKNKLATLESRMIGDSNVKLDLEAEIARLKDEGASFKAAMTSELVAKDEALAINHGKLEALRRELEAGVQGQASRATALQKELDDYKIERAKAKQMAATIAAQELQAARDAAAHQLQMMREEMKELETASKKAVEMEADRYKTELAKTLAMKASTAEEYEERLKEVLKAKEQDAQNAALALKQLKEKLVADARAERAVAEADRQALIEKREQQITQLRREMEDVKVASAALLAKAREEATASASAAEAVTIQKEKVAADAKEANEREQRQRETIIDLQERLLTAEQATLKLERQLAVSKEERDMLSSRLQEVERAHSESVTAAANKLRRVEQDWAGKLASLQENLGKVGSAQQAAAERRLCDIKEQLEKERQDDAAAFELRLAQKDKAAAEELARLSEKLRAEALAAEAIRHRADKSGKELASAIEDLQQQLRVETDRGREWEKTLQEEHALRVSTLEGQHVERLAHARGEAAARTLEAADLSAKALQAARREASEQMSEIRMAATEAAAEMARKHQAALDQVLGQGAQKVKEMTQALEAADSDLAVSRVDNERLVQEVQVAKANIEQLQLSMESAAIASVEREAGMRAHHEATSHATAEEHAQALRGMTERYGEEYARLEAHVQELQRVHAEAERRFAMRPSREEDVELIRKLEIDMLEKDMLVKKTIEEMAYFKRELLNREEVYNRKFNANPVIGVMQVVKPSNVGMGAAHVRKGGRPPRQGGHQRSMSLGDNGTPGSVGGGSTSGHSSGSGGGSVNGRSGNQHSR